MPHPLIRHIGRHWFFLGLVAVFGVTIADSTGAVAEAGRWLRARHGPDICIFSIFFLSGLILETVQIRAGFKDIGGTLLAMALIFIASPLLVLPFNWIPLDRGILIGLVLVAIMPTTLSSGVVMTGAAGGNLAHALQITIAANVLAVFSIPVMLAVFLDSLGMTTGVALNKAVLMLKLAGYVLLPLAMGIVSNWWVRGFGVQRKRTLQVISQCLIFCIVWMGVSQSRHIIAGSMGLFLKVAFLAAVFHGLLLSVAAGCIYFFRIGPGKRESILFMGSQKTLPLSIMLQVSLFPQYGAALVVCVVHHLVHLMIDGYIVGILRARHPAERP